MILVQMVIISILNMVIIHRHTQDVIEMDIIDILLMLQVVNIAIVLQ